MEFTTGLDHRLPCVSSLQFPFLAGLSGNTQVTMFFLSFCHSKYHSQGQAYCRYLTKVWFWLKIPVFGMDPKEEAVTVHIDIQKNVQRFFFLMGQFFLKKIEVIIESHTTVRNKTKASCVPFTQFTPVVLHCIELQHNIAMLGCWHWDNPLILLRFLRELFLKMKKSRNINISPYRTE